MFGESTYARADTEFSLFGVVSPLRTAHQVLNILPVACGWMCCTSSSVISEEREDLETVANSPLERLFGLTIGAGGEVVEPHVGNAVIRLKSLNHR